MSFYSKEMVAIEIGWAEKSLLLSSYQFLSLIMLTLEIVICQERFDFHLLKK